MTAESESPTVSCGLPLSNAERQARWRQKRAAERLRAADLRKDFEQRVESEVARRVGQLVGQRFADVVSGLSPIEYLCLIESMLNDLHREGRLKIRIGGTGDPRGSPVQLLQPRYL